MALPLTLITGTTHGIGKVTATELARTGHRVVMLCRNIPLAQTVAAEIRSQPIRGSVSAIHCDLANLDSVRAAAGACIRLGPINRLILNAGMAATSNRRTADGMDLNFAVNHLGHFLLVELLCDRMAEHGRIITVASRAHFRAKLDLDEVANAKERISATASYARSKLANVLHSFALARRLMGSTVTANCLHPGIVATHLLPGWLRLFQRLKGGQMFDEVRGAQSTLRLTLSSELDKTSGRYFNENALPNPASELARNVALQEALWERSLQWTGLR